MISFLRKVRYYLHLQFRLFLDNRGITTRKATRKSEIKQWKSVLLEKRSITKSLKVENDQSIILLKANQILEHQFHLLGREYFSKTQDSNDELLYKPTNWHTDPSTGYNFPKDTWYRNVRKDIPRGVDIKYPWELSRCQHFILLGEAYVISKDEKFAIEYRNQILDWIEQNPVRFGPNWSCTMEVGIRISNWLVALLYFIDSHAIDDAFLETLLTSVLEHGMHITTNLENLQPYTSNHYVANIAGLFVLAALIPKSRKKKRWLNFSSKELESEIIRQTYESGWQYEASTCYHRLVTEMFFYPFIIGKVFGIRFSENYTNSLDKMISVLDIISKTNGKIPQIGDNDSGRFFVLNHNKGFGDLNINYLLETRNRFLELTSNKATDFLTVFQDAGLFLWKNDDIYYLLTTVPKGQGGNGGHAHNDVFSYELNVNGVDLIVDPGTYCYTNSPKERDQFRSVKNHNTLCWDNIEPCSLEDGLFTLPEKGELIILNKDIDKASNKVKGLYKYQNRFHQRSVQVNPTERTIAVSDSSSNRGAFINFILAPSVSLKIEESGFWLNETWIQLNGISKITQSDAYYSPEYGVKIPTKQIQCYLKDLKCDHIIHY
jgi:hypothetical protein